jgi:hypothetical protein
MNTICCQAAFQKISGFMQIRGWKEFSHMLWDELLLFIIVESQNK